MSALQQLSRIPFENLIGGPLDAAVHAQATAAETSIEFIEKIGFVPQDPNDPNSAMSEDVRTVTFKYEKLDAGEEKNFELTVPILSIVPIPYLRIDEMTIDFNAKIAEARERDRTVTSKFAGGFGYKGKRVEFKAGYSRNASTDTRYRYSAEYNMNVHVRAVQDELPKGMSRIIDILESVITEKEDTTTAQV